MKILLLIICAATCLNAFSQTEKPAFRLRLDTCLYPPAEKGAAGVRGRPVYIANGNIVVGGEIDPDLVKDLDVLTCPKGFLKYGHIGAGPVIDLTTTQVFDSLQTQDDIKKAAGVKGEVIFAVNSLLLKDPNMKFCKKAIVETQIVTIPAIDDPSKKKTCINIWTIEKSERDKFF